MVKTRKVPFSFKTTYNGEKFDSQTEAQWAVVFDTGGVQSVHHPKPNLVTSGGRSYEPDFYLPEYGWYVEVKPRRPEYLKEIAKATDAVVMTLKKPLLLLGTIPEHDSKHSLCYFPLYYFDAETEKAKATAVLVGVHETNAGCKLRLAAGEGCDTLVNGYKIPFVLDLSPDEIKNHKSPAARELGRSLNGRPDATAQYSAQQYLLSNAEVGPRPKLSDTYPKNHSDYLEALYANARNYTFEEQIPRGEFPEHMRKDKEEQE